MAGPSARPIRAKGWPYPSISRSRLRAECARDGSTRRPQPPQTIAMAQEPMENNESVTALDRPGVDQPFNLGHSLDDDPDVLVLLGQAVNPAGRGGIDPGSEQDHAFVRIARGRQ